jgi:hypothetical protein
VALPKTLRGVTILTHTLYQDHHEPLREWGYVVWDQSRLGDIGIFKSPWEPLEISSDARLEEQQKPPRIKPNSIDKAREALRALRLPHGNHIY